jgi:BNR repeat-containing family member/PEP-CTERM motif
MKAHCGIILVIARCLPLVVVSAFLAAQPVRAQNVTFSTVAVNGYGTGDVNSCAIALNNVTSVGNFQFIGYYDNSRNLMIGRRTLGSSSWQTFSSGISIAASEITDDHNVIALAVDSAGFMHVSWNMHNVSLNYGISTAPVTGASLNSIAFTKQTAANAPTLFPSSGSTTNEVTYPQFYPIPNSSNLLFTYRNGGPGGGSGNGNQYFNIYNPSTNTWTNNFVINGVQTNVNAYLNSMAYTSTNNLLMSWTWRATPNWQTNSNIMFAQSPDNGTTWFQQGGTTQYGLPIIQSGSPANSVAQVVQAIPPNSSFINQTSMAVDQNNNPLIATYLTPNWNPATQTGDKNRQYVLVYYTGAQWQMSQISHRTSDTAIDTSGANVRDLGRPVVLVDKQNRVLVITRSEDTAMGSFSNPSTPNNKIVVFYTTNLSSGNPTWSTLTLDTANMGAWEPTYDSALWLSQNKLDLFYEPVGLSGETTWTVKVLEWDEQAFFTPVPEPTTTLLFASAAFGGLFAWRRSRRTSANGLAGIGQP